MITKRLITTAFLTILIGLGTSAPAQLGKLAGQAKSKAKSKTKNAVESNAGDAANYTETLEKDKKRLKDLAGSPNWGDAEFLKNFQSGLSYYSNHLTSAQKSTGGKAVAKRYLEDFNTQLVTYQDNVDLGEQKIYPMIDDSEQKKEFTIAYGQMKYEYKALKKREAEDKSNWGDAEWVDDFKKHLDDYGTKINTFSAMDSENMGRVERYEEVRGSMESLYNERKALPGQRKEVSDYMISKWKNYQAIQKIQKAGWNDDAGLLENVKAFDFAKNREGAAFLNEWGMKVLEESYGRDVLRTFTTDWAGEVQADVKKAMDEALNTANSHKYAFVQYNSAQRYGNLGEAASLLYPEDGAMTKAAADGKSLAASKKGAYEKETFTSDYHKNNTYTIGFSSTGSSGFSPKESFKAGEKIVLTLFFDRPLALIYGEDKYIVFKFDGPWDEEERIRLDLADADLDKSHLDYVIYGDNSFPDPAEDLVQEQFLRELVRVKGSQGEVTLNTSAIGNMDRRQQLAGKFNFNGTDVAGIGKYDTRRVALTDVRLADVRMPKAKMTNSGLAASMKTAFMNKYGEEDVVGVKRVVITSTDWAVQRNEWTGILLSRTIDAWIAYERIDGTCRIELCGFKQDYQGNNKYGPTYWNGVGDNEEISCKNINK